MPSADFCRPVRMNRFILSRDFTTNVRSPEVSSTAFRAQPPNLQPAPLMDMGFIVIRQLARRRMPLIRFLYIGSHVCSTLLSDPALQRRPCASLSLHLHQVVKRTFTFELSNMLGTRKNHRQRCLWKPNGGGVSGEPAVVEASCLRKDRKKDNHPGASRSFVSLPRLACLPDRRRANDRSHGSCTSRLSGR
jgi:hypothetical protein